MDRRKFIGDLGSPVLAVCAVCLGACSKSSDSSSTTGGATGVNFNVNLSSQLANVGDSVTQNGVIVVRIAAGNTASSFTAVQVNCTHQGTPINYNNSAGKFICPLHGSQFSQSGAVLVGPAAANLKQFSIAISGSTMTITG